MAARKIIHLDLDAFFCSVEELRRPELRGQPFAVGGRPDQRGVVASCSYAARMRGVRSAMPMARALRLCPDLIQVHGDYSAYSHASHQVMAVLRDLTPLVEQLSIDEAFMDVSDLPDQAVEIAGRLQAQIDSLYGLPCSLGIAANKLIAKMATDYGKGRHRGSTPPRAIFEVPPGGEAEFLRPLPVSALWGVGPKTAERLEELGIHTIGDLACEPEDALTRRFGRFGHDLFERSRGLDDRPVETEHATRSVSQEVTFDRDVTSGEVLRDTLRDMAEQVGYRLRQDGLCGVTVRLKLRWPDFTTPTRQLTLQQPTDQDGVIYQVAERLLETLWQPGRAVRLLGVGLSGLTESAHQLSLWDTPTEKERRLLEALDSLRERYGEDAVRPGRIWKHRKL